MMLLLRYSRACSFPPSPSLLESPLPTGDSPMDQPPLTSKDLEDSSNVKPPALGEGEELAKEQEQGQDAEDDGEDHHRLDRLQPFWEETDRNLSAGTTVGKPPPWPMPLASFPMPPSHP